VVLDNGGELLMNSRVSKIEIERSVATGIEYRSKGQILTARAATVLSAIDMHKTFHELVGANIIPPIEMKKLNDSVLGSSMPILFLGVRIPSDRMRQIFNGKEELNYFPSIRRLDADLNDIGFFSQCSMIIHSSSLVNTAHAPSGCSNVQIYLECPPVSWQQDWGLADGQPTEQYRQLKKKVVEDVLSSLERLIPELKDRSVIDVCELGTPHTNERYTGNTHGAACGFNYDGYYLSAARPRSYYSRLSNVRNLFFIGHQTGYGGGLVAALGSAQRVMNEICRR
jgi:prolycopene isomerase